MSFWGCFRTHIILVDDTYGTLKTLFLSYFVGSQTSFKFHVGTNNMYENGKSSAVILSYVTYLLYVKYHRQPKKRAPPYHTPTLNN
jgi:hypothetical protein